MSCASFAVLATSWRDTATLGILCSGCCWLCVCLGLSLLCVHVVSSCFLLKGPVSTGTSFSICFSMFGLKEFLVTFLIRMYSYVSLTSLSPWWILRFLFWSPACGHGFLSYHSNQEEHTPVYAQNTDRLERRMSSFSLYLFTHSCFDKHILDPIVDSWLKLYFDCQIKNQFGEYIYFRISLVSYEFVMKTK